MEMHYGWLFAKTIAAMLIIIGLAYAFLRFVLPRLRWGQIRQGSRIQVIERMGLTPGKAVYIIRIDSQEVAIGVAEHSVNKIMDLKPPHE